MRLITFTTAYSEGIWNGIDSFNERRYSAIYLCINFDEHFLMRHSTIPYQIQCIKGNVNTH